MIKKEVWARLLASKDCTTWDVALLNAKSKADAFSDLLYEYRRHLTGFERRHVWLLFAFRVMAYKPETPEDVERLEAMQADGVGWGVDGWLLDSLPDQCPWDSASDTTGLIFNGEQDHDYLAYKASMVKTED